MRRYAAKRYHRAGEDKVYIIGINPTTYDQKGDLSPKHLRNRGIAFVWTAIVIMALFLIVGLSIDWAKLLYNLHELQNAADAAALAGAQIVKVKPAEKTRLWTQELASDNTAEKLDVYLRTTPQDDPFTDDTNLDIILGRWINNQHYFFPTLDTPDAVKVIARRADGLTDAPPLAFLYGPIVGVDTTNARRVAIGWYNEASGAGLIVLDDHIDELGLYVLGTGDVRVIGGSIHVNSRATGTKDNPQNPAAVYVQGEGHMLSGRLTVQGHTDPAPPTEDNLNGWDNIWFDDTLAVPMEMPYDIWEGAPYMPDPLRDLVPPDANGVNTYSYNENTDGTTTLNPGYYPDGIEISQTGTTVTLNPGTYIIGGGNEPSQDSGLILTGGNLIGHGVLIYLTKDYIHTDGRWAQLDLGGGGAIDIFPPGDLPENYVDGKPVIDGLLGVSIWQDRANTENTSYLRGGGDMMISGTLYFPNNAVNLAGQPGKAGNQILCWTAQVAGNAPIVVEYDGRNNQNKGVSVLVK